MRILLTNDDGINAVGIYELARALVSTGHEVFISAPEQDQSCISHALTLRRPLHAQRRVLPGLEGVTAFAVDGTPGDCVRLALGNLGADAELVVSGVNAAPNLGTDAVYSGTVSAAIEGLMVDLPAIAVSKDTFTVDHMREAAEFFARYLPRLMAFFEEGPAMLSVNVPSCPASDFRCVRRAGLQLQTYDLRFDEVEEDGRTSYYVRPGKTTVLSEKEYTDERAMREGYVVVTPLTYDITDRRLLEKARRMFETEGSI
ncbi:MAG: 5'/3'-nucleotidase SurE [Clostridia bacterium]|nr:5'/3'-nucleotidase SurE [Clostridia bacterium]